MVTLKRLAPALTRKHEDAEGNEVTKITCFHLIYPHDSGRSCNRHSLGVCESFFPQSIGHTSSTVAKEELKKNKERQ